MEDDDLDAQLRGLPGVPLDRRLEVQTLRRARAVLASAPLPPFVAVLQRAWDRAIAPALVMGTVASYLAWAVQSAGSLYR